MVGVGLFGRIDGAVNLLRDLIDQAAPPLCTDDFVVDDVLHEKLNKFLHPIAAPTIDIQVCVQMHH